MASPGVLEKMRADKMEVEDPPGFALSKIAYMGSDQPSAEGNDRSLAGWGITRIGQRVQFLKFAQQLCMYDGAMRAGEAR
jgi:hypothetical protein